MSSEGWELGPPEGLPYPIDSTGDEGGTEGSVWAAPHSDPHTYKGQLLGSVDRRPEVAPSEDSVVVSTVWPRPLVVHGLGRQGTHTNYLPCPRGDSEPRLFPSLLSHLSDCSILALRQP